MSEEIEEPAGISKTVTWIMAIVAALFLGMGGFIFQGFNSRISALESQTAMHDNHITRLESAEYYRTSRDSDLAERLQKIEDKIDRLREQLRKGSDR